METSRNRCIIVSVWPMLNSACSEHAHCPFPLLAPDESSTNHTVSSEEDLVYDYDEDEYEYEEDDVVLSSTVTSGPPSTTTVIRVEHGDREDIQPQVRKVPLDSVRTAATGIMIVLEYDPNTILLLPFLPYPVPRLCRVDVSYDKPPINPVLRVLP